MSTDQPRVNQWEAPRKDDYSSMNRREDRTRQYEDDRNEDVQPTRTRENQFPPTKYELKREGPRTYNKQASEDYQRNQEPQNRPQRQYSGYDQPEPKEQYREPVNNKYGNQSRGGRNVEKEEYSGSYQQQQPFNRLLSCVQKV